MNRNGKDQECQTGYQAGFEYQSWDYYVLGDDAVKSTPGGGVYNVFLKGYRYPSLSIGTDSSRVRYLTGTKDMLLTTFSNYGNSCLSPKDMFTSTGK